MLVINSSHIIFDDKYICVVNKPHGLQCEPDKLGYPDLVTELKRFLNKNNRPPKLLQPVNRIDRPVGGLMLLAKTPTALRQLGLMQEKRCIEKMYVAMVDGFIEKDEATLHHFILKNTEEKRAEVGNTAFASAKPCVLSYRVLTKTVTASRLLIRLETGRYHQIRAQMSFVGNPIVGDAYYGSKMAFKENGICLHASELAFSHPITGEKLKLESSPEF